MKYAKWILIFILIVKLILLNNIFVFSLNGVSEYMEDQKSLIGDNLQKEINNYKYIEEFLPSYTLKEMLSDMISGKFKYSTGDILKKISEIFFREMFISFKIGIKIICALLIIGLLNLLKNSIGGDKAGQIAFYCGYAMISILLYNSISLALNMTNEIIKNATDFTYAMLPILMTLMTLSGQLASTAIFKPFYILSFGFCFGILKKIILPLITLQISIVFISNFSEKINLNRILSLTRQITLWLIGIFLTIFTTVLSMQGTLGYGIDSVTAKSTKFAIGTFVPFAGKYISDAGETVLAYTMLLKNSVGVLSMIIIILICAIPLIKIIAMSLFFKLLTVTAEFIADAKFSSLFNDVSNIFLMMVGILVSIIFMFYISVCFVVGSVGLR